MCGCRVFFKLMNRFFIVIKSKYFICFMLTESWNIFIVWAL